MKVQVHKNYVILHICENFTIKIPKNDRTRILEKNGRIVAIRIMENAPWIPLSLIQSK